MEIQHISPETLESLFGDPQEVTPTPTPETPEVIDTTDSPIVIDNSNNINVDNIDFEALLNEEPSKDVEDTPAEPPSDVTTKDSVPSVLKSTVDFMISKGYWKDFEGREELDITEDVYAELAAKQFESRLNDEVSEILDSTGEYGKAILEFSKNGGNPDEIIDLFKEQKQFERIDTTSDEGKVELVGKFYSEILGWKPERVTKHVQRIIADDDLDSEVSEIEDKYKEYYSAEVEKAQAALEERNRAKIENQKRFESSLMDALTDLNYSAPERKKISKALLEAKRDDNGGITTDFNSKFAEIQKDPKRLVKLVEYVLDDAAFIAKIEKSTTSKTEAKTFNFIKGNVTANKTRSNATPEPKDSKQSLDFSFLLNKK